MARESLVVLWSYHHGNTEKVAKAIAGVLDARIKTPLQIRPGELGEYDLIGFGSGIYGARHHELLLDLADRMPRVASGNAFLFSTYGAPEKFATGGFIAKNHLRLRERLVSKGYGIIGEFGCAGLNTNSFLKLLRRIEPGPPRRPGPGTRCGIREEHAQRQLNTQRDSGQAGR